MMIKLMMKRAMISIIGWWRQT